MKSPSSVQSLFSLSGQRLTLLYKHNLFLRFKLILLTSQIFPTDLTKSHRLSLAAAAPQPGFTQTVAAYRHYVDRLYMIPTSSKYTLSDEYLSHCCNILCRGGFLFLPLKPFTGFCAIDKINLPLNLIIQLYPDYTHRCSHQYNFSKAQPTRTYPGLLLT